MPRSNRNNKGGGKGSKKKTGSVSLPSASSPSASTARHPQSNGGYASLSSSMVPKVTQSSSSHSGNPMHGVGGRNGRESPRATPVSVGGIQGPSSSSRGFCRDSASTISSGCRHSTASTSSDPSTQHLKRSVGQRCTDERAKWAFVLDPNGGQDNRNGKERSSISSIGGGGDRLGISSSSTIGSSAGFQEVIAPSAATEWKWGRDKQKGATPWKGMTPEDESYRQSIIIHKHSKAAAFSISRLYRPKVSLESQGRSSSSAYSNRMPISNIDRWRPSLLLASRKVQEAYTSTDTTRKLESHGLLNENGRNTVQ